tara:strand:+ start:248 stop:451 length:204 start_codon:yes stop_codon:yes gene_type:complete
MACAAFRANATVIQNGASKAVAVAILVGVKLVTRISLRAYTAIIHHSLSKAFIVAVNIAVGRMARVA